MEKFYFDLQLFAEEVLLDVDTYKVSESIEKNLQGGDTVKIVGKSMTDKSIRYYNKWGNGTLEFVRTKDGHGVALMNGVISLADSSVPLGSKAFLQSSKDGIGANIQVNNLVSNNAACALILEVINGLPNAAVWQGNPGVGGTFEYKVSYGKAKPYTVLYQAMNDDGTIIKCVRTGYNAQRKLEKAVGYAVLDADFFKTNGNGLIALGMPGYSDKLFSKDKLSQDVQNIIDAAERTLNGHLTEITDLDYSKKTSAALYSLATTPTDDGNGGDAKEGTKVSVVNVKEDSDDAGLRGKVVLKDGKNYFVAADEAYLKVTANTSAGFTTIQVDWLGWANKNANGALRSYPSELKKWTGTLTLSGVKDKDATTYTEKYAKLKYTKPAKSSLVVNDAAIGSVFVGWDENDVIETAATTGNEAVTLKKGSYNIYHTVKNNPADNAKYDNTIYVRTVAVTGSADVKIKEGQLSYLGNFSKGSKVTLTDKKETISYELKGDSYWKTETINGKKVSYKTAATEGLDVLKVSEDAWSFAGGTEALSGTESVKVGNTTITAAGTAISVTAKGDSYTIGGIKAGDYFKVEDKAYTRYGNALFTGEGENRRELNLGAGKVRSLTSVQMNNAKLWKKAVEADANYVVENISLAQVDALVAKNNKAEKETAAEMSFIHDRFVIEGTKKAARNTTLAETYDADFQHQAGKADTKDKNYNAESATADQKINAASGWTITAGKYNDTIIGAAAVKGKADEVTTYNAGAGHNTIKLGSAKEKVIVGTEGSYDTITGYASGKDEISVGAEGKGEWKYLVKGSNLYITNAEQTLENVDANQHALLKGAAVSTKAVTINGKEYYFGGVNVNVTRDKKTKKVTSITATNKQSNTFIYKDGAYYMGSTTTTADDYNPAAKVKSGLDKLKVQSGADKDAQVNIDLTTDHYVSIDAVDASGMKAPKGTKAAEMGEYKGVNVTAGSTGLRFTGSKFDDTVNCGEGKDYIIIGKNQGKDTINNFDVGDVIQLNHLRKNDIKALKESEDLRTTLANKYGLTVNVAEGKSLSITNNKITAVNNG